MYANTLQQPSTTFEKLQEIIGQLSLILAKGADANIVHECRELIGTVMKNAAVSLTQDQRYN